MTANRMFSPEALTQFRKFLAVDSRTHARPGTPQGAFDQVTKPLRRAMARDAEPERIKFSSLEAKTPAQRRREAEAAEAQRSSPPKTAEDDDDDADPIESGKRGDIDQLIQLASEMCGGDKESMDRFFQQLERSFPGSIGEMSDNVTEDTADLDDPPANEFGERYSGQRGAVYGDMPAPFKSMPKPGGEMFGEDASYRALFGDSHIGLDPISAAPPSREALLAMDEGGDNSYLEMFPETARIKNLY